MHQTGTEFNNPEPLILCWTIITFSDKFVMTAGQIFKSENSKTLEQKIAKNELIQNIEVFVVYSPNTIRILFGWFDKGTK